MIPTNSLALDFDSFLVDLDGVVYVGSDPVPGAAETLNAVTAVSYTHLDVYKRQV